MRRFFRTVLDKIPTAVIVVDQKLRVRFTNRALLDFFGTQKRKGEMRDLISCDERAKVCGTGERCRECQLRRLFLSAQNNKGAAFRRIVVNAKENGARITCPFRVSPMGKKYLVAMMESAHEAEITRELYTAQSIQQKLLPPPHNWNGTPYSYMYIPCRAIGGDLPDVYQLEGDTMGFLADVSGKGISAGMLSAFVKAGWNKSDSSPSQALRGLNSKFQELNLDESNYVTAAAIRIDKTARQIRYSLAGHNAPMLLKSGAGINEIEMNAPPVSNWIPDFGYEDQFISYHKGDILVMMTDGIIENKNQKGEIFSLERVEDLLRKAESAESFIESLKATITSFCGTFSDDLTAIAFDLQ